MCARIHATLYIRYFILYALSRFLLPFVLKNYFAKGVSIHNSRVSSVLGFKRRLQIERRSHYVFLSLRPLAAPEPGWVWNCKWARLGGCASHGVVCYRRELLHIWLHLFFYSFEKLKDLFLSSLRLRFILFFQLYFFPQLMCSDWAGSVCQFVKVSDWALRLPPSPGRHKFVNNMWNRGFSQHGPFRYHFVMFLVSMWVGCVTSHRAWCNKKHDTVLCIVCIRKTFLGLWYSMGPCRASRRTNHPPKVLTF